MKTLILLLLLTPLFCIAQDLNYDTAPAFDNLQVWNIETGTDQDNGLAITQAKVFSLNKWEVAGSEDVDAYALCFIGQKRGTLVASLIVNGLEFDIEQSNAALVSYDGKPPVKLIIDTALDGKKGSIKFLDPEQFRGGLFKSERFAISAYFKDKGFLKFEFDNGAFNQISFTE
jgi:hypothetical protein